MAVQPLNVYTVTNPTSDPCGVCLSPLNDGSDTVVAHPDGGELHPFHNNCLGRSVVVTRDRCPTCKKAINIFAVQPNPPVARQGAGRDPFVAIVRTFGEGAIFAVASTITILGSEALRSYIDTAISGQIHPLAAIPISLAASGAMVVAGSLAMYEGGRRFGCSLGSAVAGVSIGMGFSGAVLLKSVPPTALLSAPLVAGGYAVIVDTCFTQHHID